MNPSLPKSTEELLASTWSTFQPVYEELAARQITPANVDAWLKDWSDVNSCVIELKERLYVAKTRFTADEHIDAQFNDFMDNIYPAFLAAEQKLKEKLLASKLEPKGYAVQMRNMRAEADLFREENLPLLAEEQKMISEYDAIVGSQTVLWEGGEVTVTQLKPVYLETDREKRERAWRTATERQLADREKFNSLWQRFLGLRFALARNAGKPDFRAYMWQKLFRFDYIPEDAKKFGDAIEQAVVPAARRIYARRQQQMGLSSLRPWDLDVDPFGRQPLQPFQDENTLIQKTSAIFRQVDPQLGEYFDIMVREDLLDLMNRKNKGPGAYCDTFPLARKPFIFHNAVGIHDDVQTMLHESGHAFHVFEAGKLPYAEQLNYPMEIAEVASMSMELLAAPYLKAEKGGYYNDADYARARIEHLEGNILFWPYMAVVDSFQHWVYEHPQMAMDPQSCDAAWNERWERFMQGVDWSGLEDVKVTGWQRKMHIFEVPFYYIEYGLAQMGAAMVWRNALRDQAGAVKAYRRALSLGNSATLPELYQAAGARLAFDAGTLGELVALCEEQIAGFEEAAG
jgi:oligoendopeptidase F